MNEAPKKRRRGKGAEPKGMTVGDYDVGKGKPPMNTRWKEGCPSPNPKGRPRKPRPGTRDIDHFLNERVTVSGPDGSQTYTKRELGYLQFANLVAKGVPWAIKLAKAIEKSGSETQDPLLFDPTLTRQLIEEGERELTPSKPKRSKGASSQ